MNPSLPIVDIHSGTSPIDDLSVAQQLDMALQKHGFCYISGHNIATDTIKTAFEATHRFHALPESAKQDIKINPCHRGYIGFNTSTAVTSSVEKPFRPNYSESFMAMQPVFSDHARWGTAIFGPNQWPESLMPAFKTEVEDYYEAMEYLALELVQRLAVALGQDPHIFDQAFDDPTVFLRLLHYPAVADSTAADGYGSAPHTDHGFLTLVSQDLTGGLEVLT
ncbi:MAG: 2-oxoglutarate and iron-dependent oxygenase domain-containing protein, partial [Pseudomonadota bacterium]